MGISTLLTLLSLGSSVFSFTIEITAHGSTSLETNWESQLEHGLAALESNCDQNYTPFNRDKIENELKSCLRDVIDGTIGSPSDRYFSLTKNPKKQITNQLDILRHYYIEPVCDKISQSLSCLQPHRRIIDTCAREDGKLLHRLMEVSCEGNGTRLIQFIEEGGVDCVLSQREILSKCFTDHQKKNLTTSEDVCGYFDETRTCLITSMAKCQNKEPGKILETLIEDAILKTKGNCLKSNLYSKKSNMIFENRILNGSKNRMTFDLSGFFIFSTMILSYKDFF